MTEVHFSQSSSQGIHAPHSFEVSNLAGMGATTVTDPERGSHNLSSEDDGRLIRNLADGSLWQIKDASNPAVYIRLDITASSDLTYSGTLSPTNARDAINAAATMGQHFKISDNDTSTGSFESKVTAGPNIGFTVSNDGANETISISASITGSTVKVSSNDTTPNYLSSKLVAGENITIDSRDDGGNETIAISASASPSTDQHFKVSTNDTSTGSFQEKITAGPNIGFTVSNEGANETLSISASITGSTVKVSTNDSTPDYLESKFVAGPNITIDVRDDGGNETIAISASAGGGSNVRIYEKHYTAEVSYDDASAYGPSNTSGYHYSTVWNANYGSPISSTNAEIVGWNFLEDCQLSGGTITYGSATDTSATNTPTMFVCAVSGTQGQSSGHPLEARFSQSFTDITGVGSYTAKLSMPEPKPHFKAGEKLLVLFSGSNAVASTLEMALYLRFEATGSS